jgi:hypothetical protein
MESRAIRFVAACGLAGAAAFGARPDPVNFEGRNQDLIYRFTFFWTL